MNRRRIIVNGAARMERALLRGARQIETAARDSANLLLRVV